MVRGGTPGATPAPAPSSLPAIGPAGQGNVLIAWDPVAQKERWRGVAGGYNNGGALSTGGNLVFSVDHNRLLAYRADNGDQLLDLDTGQTLLGPPITFSLDGKQYVAIAGGPIGISPQGGRGAAPVVNDSAAHGNEPAPAAGPLRRSHLLVFTLGGKATLPTNN